MEFDWVPDYCLFIYLRCLTSLTKVCLYTLSMIKKIHQLQNVHLVISCLPNAFDIVVHYTNSVTVDEKAMIRNQ